MPAKKTVASKKVNKTPKNPKKPAYCPIYSSKRLKND